MLNDGLIYSSVKQISFLEWINDTYDLDVSKTSNYNKTSFRIDWYQEAIDLYKSKL